MAEPDTGRRRPAWDEVQERQRRDRARVDAEHAAAVAANPDPSLGVWRVCGQELVDDAPGRGCSCGPGDPTTRRVSEALIRLADERAAARVPHG